MKLLTRWKVACVVGLALGPALLGLTLTALAVVAEAVAALKSSTGEDITIPLIVALVGAALYDRIIHVQDLYWQAVDDSLDAVLNKLPRGAPWDQPPTCTDPDDPLCQRRVFNSTHAMLGSGRRRHRAMALRRIIDAPICSQVTAHGDWKSVIKRTESANPWDSGTNMLLCYGVVAFVIPLLLWCGGELMSAILGVSSQWPVGIFVAAAVVGVAGVIAIVGRPRSRLSIDVLAVGTWAVLGLVVAPVLGLAPQWVAIVCYAVLLLSILAYVLGFGRGETALVHAMSWSMAWTLLAAFFSFSAYRLVLYQ
ncbi:MAG TPA: hypothetical protein VME22_02525 [Solirubrobacteraceae bacterium]|nr:hypothetical protein [Solirubrobacteraceae bacterium]